MLDSAHLSHNGRHRSNYDVLRFSFDEHQDSCNAVLCDGLNGSPDGDLAAEFCAMQCLELLANDCNPRQAAEETQRLFMERRENERAFRKAATTICALQIKQDRCDWANIGDSRLYHFSDGRPAHISVDDSAAYPEFLSGKLAYEDLRLHALRTRLSAAIGDERQAEAHCESFLLRDGDALLICSDGFWQYVYETEMCIDLIKSKDAERWLQLMSLRLAARSFLEGDNLTALALIYRQNL